MNRHRACVIVGLGLGIALAPLGCASRTDRAEERALEEGASFRHRLDAMPDVIDGTMQRLLAATAGQNPNRANDFARFQTSLDNMHDAARYVGIQYQEALADTNAFYAEWSRESRRLTAAERQEVQAAMGQSLATRNDAVAYFDRARTSFTDLTVRLDEIEASLAGNLSEQNVLAQSPLIERAIRDANDTKNFIARLDEVLDAAVGLR